MQLKEILLLQKKSSVLVWATSIVQQKKNMHFAAALPQNKGYFTRADTVNHLRISWPKCRSLNSILNNRYADDGERERASERAAVKLGWMSSESRRETPTTQRPVTYTLRTCQQSKHAENIHLITEPSQVRLAFPNALMLYIICKWHARWLSFTRVQFTPTHTAWGRLFCTFTNKRTNKQRVTSFHLASSIWRWTWRPDLETSFTFRLQDTRAKEYTSEFGNLFSGAFSRC